MDHQKGKSRLKQTLYPKLLIIFSFVGVRCNGGGGILFSRTVSSFPLLSNCPSSLLRRIPVSRVLKCQHLQINKYTFTFFQREFSRLCLKNTVSGAQHSDFPPKKVLHFCFLQRIVEFHTKLSVPVISIIGDGIFSSNSPDFRRVSFNSALCS